MKGGRRIIPEWRRALLCVLLCLCCHVAKGQEVAGEWEAFVEAWLVDEEVADDEAWTQWMEELRLMHDQPMNINTATREELEQLPFLTEKQVEDILAYIYLHGSMQTLGELLLVPSLDATARRWLRLFVTTGHRMPEGRTTEAGNKTHLFAPPYHHDFNTRLDVPLYYRKGQQTDGGYRGDALYQRMRYTLKGRHLRVGLRAEKDAGERYFDSYGAFAEVRQVGRWQSLLVGDYRAAFGEGLVMGGGAWHAKSQLQQRRGSGLRPMVSMAEVDFLRGAAATVTLPRGWTLTALASYRKVDATLTDGGEVRTLVTSGYHRSSSEWAQRRNTATALVGANATWQRGTLYLGATGYYQHFARRLNPGEELYRRIYPRGQNFGAMGLHYGYQWHDLRLAGETAVSPDQMGVATLNRASYHLSRNHVLSLVQRYYSRDYHSFHASALGENTRVQNENGVLLHWSGQPWAAWHVVAYADFFFHQWPTYGMKQSNVGQELMAQTTYNINRRHRIVASYRWKNKLRNDLPDPQHRVQAQWTFLPNSHWQCSLRGALHHVPTGTGMGLQATLRHDLPRPALRWGLALAYAHTPDYQSRLYFYEPSLYQTFASLSLQGHCLRGALTVRWTTLGDRLTLEGRYGILRYFDREQQGSGLQTIYSPWKNDLQVQVRVKI